MFTNKKRCTIPVLSIIIFYLLVTNNGTSLISSGKCLMSLPVEAFSISQHVTDNYFLSKEVRMYLKENPDKLNASMLSNLVSGFVDVDNSISKYVGSDKTDTLRVTYLNAQRGGFWCELADLIRKNDILKYTDVWILNEFDLGMARSNNLHTVRLFAYALGLNYAFGIEFLELSHGNLAEIEKVNSLGGIDEYGLHGNAILSKYPIRNSKIIRSSGIELLYQQKNKFTAQGSENRLGGRMTLFCSIETPSGKLFSVASSHQQAFLEDPTYDSLKKVTLSLLKMYITQLSIPVIFGGDIWPDLCKNLDLKEFITSKTQLTFKGDDGSIKYGGLGGDYICSSKNGIVNVSKPTIIPAAGIDRSNSSRYEVYTDHQMISFTFDLK